LQIGLEAYDCSVNFTDVDDIVNDDGDGKMKLPDGNTFRDVTSASNLPPTTAADIAAYLHQHGAMLDASAVNLYQAR